MNHENYNKTHLKKYVFLFKAKDNDVLTTSKYFRPYSIITLLLAGGQPQLQELVVSGFIFLNKNSF